MGKYLDNIGLANLIGKIKTALGLKQDTLVSGTNIKTVNNQSLLGSGNIAISGGSSLPSGGSINDVLVKNSGHEGDLAWRSPDDVVLDAFTVFSEDWQDEGVPYFMWDSPNSVHIEFRDYLPLSGGAVTGDMDITGNLDIQGGGTSSHSDTIDTDQSNSNVSANTYYPATGWMDRDGRYFAFIQAAAFTNGTTRLSLAARNLVNNSTRTDSYLTLDMLKDGTKKATFNGTMTSAELGFSSTGVEVYLSNQTKDTRIALTSSHNLRVDSSSDSGGTWSTHGYAVLGTQAPSATAYRAANQVLATPNGSAGLPSMRKLVAADMDGLGDTAHGTGQSGIANAKAAVSCASGSTVNLDTITLAAGTWLVTYSVEWASNASGRRVMTLATNATSISSTPVYMESGAPANGLATNFSRTQVIVATSSTTRYLNAYQNSGSALNCRSCIQAVRIA